MGMSSSSTLGQSIISVNNSAYSYSSGNTLIEKEWKIILEDISKTEISYSPSRIFNDLNKASQPAVDFFKRVYPNASSDEDLIRHYVMSVWLSQKLGSAGSLLVGIAKEIFDQIGATLSGTGEGFDLKDLGADFAGAAQYTPQQAIDKGLLSRNSSYNSTPKYNIETCMALCAYLNPNYTESATQRSSAQLLLSNLSEGQPLNIFFNRGGGSGYIGYSIIAYTLDGQYQPNIFTVGWNYNTEPQPSSIVETVDPITFVTTVTINWPSVEFIAGNYKYTVAKGSQRFDLIGGGSSTLYPMNIPYTSNRI
jgi:hypothetical protein